MDLKILTGELQKELLNYRLLNIYNGANSTRQYVLKFAVPDSKKSLVVDCGNKLHLTDFERPIAPAPSNFVAKLRKHLKTRRLSQIKQVENDRVVVLEFSDGLFYLVLEFFSAGNILLLDNERKILSLQRLVNDLGPDNDKYAVNETYKVFDRSLFENELVYEPRSYSVEDLNSWVSAHKDKVASLAKDATSEKKKMKVFSIHKLLFVNVSHLSSDLILKTLHDNGVKSSQSCLDLETDKDLQARVVQALNDTETRYVKLLEMANAGALECVIAEKKNPLFNPEDENSLEYVHEEFHPFVPHKEKGDFRFITVKGYNKTLDTFFSTIESTKYTLRIEQQKQHAQKRLNTAKTERDKQIMLLQAQQEANEKKGNAIMYHAELVERCKEFVQDMLNKQMDWTDIEKLITFEASRGKEEAKFISLPLNLVKNRIKLALNDIDQHMEVDESVEEDSEYSLSSELESESELDTESESDSDSDSDTDRRARTNSKHTKDKKQNKSVPKVNVDIDLGLSAFANARLYFDSKKIAVSKQSKVEKSAGMALKNAEKKIQRDLQQTLKNETDALKAIRAKFWFEKYFWFVTTDGYLCLAGRDDSQTDMIYYRHFSDDDYFVSADLDGSLKVFILNPFVGEDVSPSTLFQAGIFALLTSTAWNGKVSSSAWWLKGSDVTKKEFDGSLLEAGRFNYKEKKNYMPAAQLVMGFAFYWLVDEDTAKKYTDARISRQEEHGLKVSIHNKKKDLENINLKEQEPEKKEVEEDRTDKVGEAENEDTASPEPSNEADSTKKDPSAKPKNVRGKKGKLKKMSTKYADQDDEERRLRMEALGTLKQVEELRAKEVQEAEHQNQTDKEKYAKARSGTQSRENAKRKELQKYLEDDDESDDRLYLEMLDALLAKPHRDDVVANIVPVFAPWTALGKFKYKVKIQPGLGKKGKSLNDTLAYFSNRKVDPSGEDLDVDWLQEHEIIKTAKANDLIGAFTVNKVKLVLPGGSASDNKAKKGGKKRK